MAASDFERRVCETAESLFRANAAVSFCLEPLALAAVQDALARVAWDRVDAPPHRIERWSAPPNDPDAPWLASRWALSQALVEILDSAPRARCSMSHTFNGAIALAVASTPGLAGVGIDIERTQRRVSPELTARLERYRNAPDETPVQVWTSIEARLKASGVEYFPELLACRGDRARTVADADWTVSVAGYWPEPNDAAAR